MAAAHLIIQKKRDGHELLPSEIKTFVHEHSQNKISDHQMSAFLMAVHFQGLCLSETIALTEAFVESGECLDLSKIEGPKVDIPSTGGWGDKVALILVPLAAACGLKVPMVLGRRLGFTGGTLNKLEAIKGMEVHLSPQQIEETLKTVGCFIADQSQTLAPAGRRVFSLGEATATSDSIPLIAASLLSKKIAEGSQYLVVDIKVGSGASIKTQTQAKQFAKLLIQISKKMKLSCRIVLTNMDQPLGYSVGNLLEVVEAVEVLQNIKSPQGLTSGDLKELAIQLCALLLEATDQARTVTEGRKLSYRKLLDGSAWQVFQKLVESQKGNLQFTQALNSSNLETLLKETHQSVWLSPISGYINKMNVEKIGQLLGQIGGPSLYSGFHFYKKLGSAVAQNEPVVKVFASAGLSPADLKELESQFLQSLEISSSRKPVPKLILETL